MSSLLSIRFFSLLGVIQAPSLLHLTNRVFFPLPHFYSSCFSTYSEFFSKLDSYFILFFEFLGAFQNMEGKMGFLKMLPTKATIHRDRNRRKYDVVVVERWRCHMAGLTMG
jgi:hypothetical protein